MHAVHCLRENYKIVVLAQILLDSSQALGDHP